MDAEQKMAVDAGGEPRRLLRTRRLLLRAYAFVGSVALLAVAVFGPGWALWLPLMTVFALSLAGLEHLVGIRAWSESDETSKRRIAAESKLTRPN